MRHSRFIRTTLGACAVLLLAAGGAPGLFAFCDQPYPVFQCGDLGYFAPVPGPHAPGDVEAVFWQIGFGNHTIALGTTSDTGTGISGKGIFAGNDSGTFSPSLADAHALFSSFPPGSVCLDSNNWANTGVDGCVDNPRIDTFVHDGHYLLGDDFYLNPYFNTALHPVYQGYYSIASMMDYPIAALLTTPDGLYFAVAAVASDDWDNDGSGENGPCAPIPGTNPGPCVDLFGSPGFYSFGTVSNGLANPLVPGSNSVVPWQSTPQPQVDSSQPVDPGDPNSDLLISLSWTPAVVHHDQTVRPSANPTMAPADPNSAPGVGVADIESTFGLVRYVIETAAVTDRSFSAPVGSVECPGDPACTGGSSVDLVVPLDHCVRIQTLFGTKPRTGAHSVATCRLGKCGDIGYGVTSDRACFLADCVPEPEICDGLDNNCDGDTDEDFNIGNACTAPGACGAGVLECADQTSARCSTAPGGSQDGSSPEICDGVDNDCDGLVDEDFGVGDACTALGTCGPGVVECAGEFSSRCSTEPGGSQDRSSPEVCDGLDNDCDGPVDEDFGVGDACTALGTCGPGVVECAEDLSSRCSTEPGGSQDGSSPEVCDGLDNDCDGFTDEIAGTSVGAAAFNPATLNVNAQGSQFSATLSLLDACDPSVPIDGRLVEDAWISRVGSFVLPDPATIPCPGPGGTTLFERGIVDNVPQRVFSGTDVTLRYNLPTDGSCFTLDGDRQELLALLSATMDGATATLCVAGRIPGGTFEVCGEATVLNKGNR